MTAPANKGPQVTGPNMYYQEQHANGDTTITFGVDTIPVQVTTPNGKETVEINRADMKQHGEEVVQVGKRPTPPPKPKSQSVVRIVKEIRFNKKLLERVSKEIDEYKTMLRHGEFLQRYEIRKSNARIFQQELPKGFNKEKYLEWLQSQLKTPDSTK